jgi:hypothetical protein
MVEACLKLLELGYFELKIAFEGLADENLWKRLAWNMPTDPLVGDHYEVDG